MMEFVNFVAAQSKKLTAIQIEGFLIVKSSECEINPLKWETIKTISTPDGLPAFYVVRRLSQV